MTGADVVAAIERGIQDPAVRREAAVIFAETSQAALANEHNREPGKVRTSDAGRCSLELWAELHGKQDVDVDVATQLTRFDIGTIYGAWLAAVLKAELDGCGYHVLLEADITRNGVTGHADALVYGLPDMSPEIAAEFKSTYGNKQRGALPFQTIQVVNYALAADFPRATVVTIAPASFPAENRLRHDDYDPAEWQRQVDAEYSRLSRATGDLPAPADPDAPFRCRSCRYSACSKNTNPFARAIA